MSVQVSITVEGDVTFSDEEWAELEAEAARIGMSVETYLREEPSYWWAEFEMSDPYVTIDVI